MKFIRAGSLVIAGLAATIAAGSAPLHAQQEAPRGWMGLLITTGVGQRDPSGAMVFSDYPVIESIDPGSPAEKAGLQAGDILLSINSQDFRKNPVPLNTLLVPGQRVILRYRRNDTTMNGSLVVAERPAGTSRRVQLSIIGPDPMTANREIEEGMTRRVQTRVALPPLVSIAPVAFGSGTSSIRIAGAELTQMNDGLRNALKVRGDGLFVVNVISGTPAGIAGLKSGDVIIRAEREAMQNPGQIIRLLSEATTNSLALEVMRSQKRKLLTLRW